MKDMRQFTDRSARLGCALIVSILGLAACGAVDVDSELLSARESFDAGDYARANVHLSNVLQEAPDNAEARILRAGISLAIGEYRAAAVDFESALDRGAALQEIVLDYADALINSGAAAAANEVLLDMEAELEVDPAYWLLRAEAAFGLRNQVNARDALELAESLGEPVARTYVVRAGLAADDGDLQAAEAALDQGRMLFPEDPRLWQVTGQFYSQTGRPEEAPAALEQAAALYRERGMAGAEVPVLLTLIQAQLTVDDADGAGTALQRLNNLAPNSAIALYGQGLFQYHAENFEQARDLLQRSVALQPDIPQIITLLGAAQLALGNLGQAEQNLMRANNLAPGNPAAIKLLAETRLRQGRPEAALDAIELLGNAGTSDAGASMLGGRASLQAGDAERGLSYIEEAAALDTDDPNIRLELARAYIAAGRPQDASEVLAGGFSGQGDAPQFEAGLLALFAEIQSGDADAGRAAAERLVAENPDEPRAMAAAATFYFVQGDIAQGDALLEQAVALDSGFVPARLLRAERLVRDGRNADAEAELLSANAAAPDDPRINRMLGALALNRGDATSAADYFAAAFAALPNDAALAVSLADAQLRSGDTESSRATIDSVSGQLQQSPALRSALAVIELREGNVAAAARIGREMQTDFPDLSAGFLVSAEAAIAAGRFDEAAESFEQAFARDSLYSIRERWINALLRAGLDDEALAQRLAAVEAEPDNFVALNNAAWRLNEVGRTGEALGMAARAVELAGQNAQVLDTYGWILISANREQDAVPILEQALALQPNIPEISYHFAVALVGTGREDEARRVLERLLADSGEFAERAAAEALLGNL